MKEFMNQQNQQFFEGEQKQQISDQQLDQISGGEDLRLGGTQPSPIIGVAERRPVGSNFIGNTDNLPNNAKIGFVNKDELEPR